MGLSPLWCRNWTMPCVLDFSATTSPSHVHYKLSVEQWCIILPVTCHTAVLINSFPSPFCVLFESVHSIPQAYITQIFLIGALFSELRTVRFPQRMMYTWSSPQIVPKGLWWAMPREVPRNCTPCSDVKTGISSFDVFRIIFLFAIESVHSSEAIQTLNPHDGFQNNLKFNE